MRITEGGDYRSELLDALPWVLHGFGTKRSGEPDLPLATVKQIHSATILDAGGRAGSHGEADGLVSQAPGLAVAVKTADCVPILLADRERRVVAAVHAGWRGTAAEIVRNALVAMGESYGTKPPDVIAAMGPAIGKCCFEVGPEVAREFWKWDARLARSNGKEHLDLESVNCTQLVQAGIPSDQIDRAGLCTLCGSSTFHSFRRDKQQAGRMKSWIGILEN